MGCDIHIAIEREVYGKWFMVNRAYHMGHACDRNYERFAMLANVRGNSDRGLPPRGIPSDVSDSTQLYINEWGEDGHSHSHLDAKLAAAIFLATDHDKSISDFDRMYPLYRYFGIEEDNSREHGEHRIVFWFDN